MKKMYNRIGLLILALVALWALTIPALADGFTVTVTSAADATGAGTYEVGAVVSATAGPAPAETLNFAYWKATGITLSDPRSSNISFAMPGNDVALEAVFTAKTPVKLTGGAQAGWKFGETAPAFDTSTLVATTYGENGQAVTLPVGTQFTYSYAGAEDTQYAPSATPPTAVGNYALTVTIPDVESGSYVGYSDPIPFSIEAQTIQITGVTLSDWIYGETAPSPDLNQLSVVTAGENGQPVDLPQGTAFVYTYAGAGDTQYSPSETRPSQAGNYTVTLSLPETVEEYTGSSEPIPFAIKQRPLHITGITVSDRTYDGSTAVAVSGTPVIKEGDWLEQDGEAPAISMESAAGTLESAAVGSDKAVTLTGISLSSTNLNYTLVFENLTVDITPAPWNDNNIIWGDAKGYTYPRNYDGEASAITAKLELFAGESVPFAVQEGIALQPGSYVARITDFADGKGTNYAPVPENGYTYSYTIHTSGLTGSLTTDGVSAVSAVGHTVTATATVNASIENLTFQWKRNGTAISGANTSVYTLVEADAGQEISVTVTSAGSVVGSLESAKFRVMPMQLSGTLSISGNTTVGSILTVQASLNAASGYTFQWYNDAGDIPGALGNTYTIQQTDLGTNLYVRASATPATDAAYAGNLSSGAYAIPGQPPAVPVIDVAADTSTISVSWNPPANNGSPLTGYYLIVTPQGGSGLSYPVNADATNFVVSGLNAGTTYTVYLRAVNSYGSTSSSVVTVTVQAAYTGSTPDAPTRESRSTSRITLKKISGYEYSMDGKTWQSSNVFSGLKEGTKYSFYQRVAETATSAASPASPKYSCYTLSSSDEDDDDSSSSSSGSSSSGSSSSGSTATESEPLYELTLTGSTSNVLFSTMNRLVDGNKEKDVTISFPNVRYSFGKGTMQAESGRVWYDFGLSINNCIHNNAIKALAGDWHVATIHYNYGGTLPAQATIQIQLGTQYAGQKLYYYKYDEAGNALSFIQTSTVDANGWASVTQSQCSDYVFTSGDVTTAFATPAPTALPSPTPAAGDVPLAGPVEVTKKGPDWILIGIIALAALLLIAIIWLWLRRSDESSLLDDEDFYEEDYEEFEEDEDYKYDEEDDR